MAIYASDLPAATVVTESDNSPLPDERAAPVPWWFELGLRAALVAVLAVAIAGLPLAMVGWFRPLPTAVLATAVAAALWAVWPAPERRRTDRATNGWAVAALAVVGVMTLLNARYASQHLEVNRDPGVYVTTARWLAEEGDLLVAGLEGPFAAQADDLGLRATGNGFFDGAPGGDLYAQFWHLLPVYAAVGDWVGGPAVMLRVPALLGGISLLALYALGARLLRRPALAFVATAALSVNLIQVHFSRDAYSEIPSQLLLLAGLWLVAVAVERARNEHRIDPRLAGLAGLSFGTTAMTRIDAFVGLAPVLLVAGALAIWPLAATSRERWTAAAAMGGATLAAAAIGYVDGTRFSPVYVGDLEPEWSQSLLAVAAAGLLAVAAAAWTRWRAPLAALRSRHARWLAPAAAAAVVVVGLGLWFVRPEVQTVVVPRAEPPTFGLTAGIQAREGTEVNAWRTYDEQTFSRLAFYVGPIALAAAIGGAAVVAHRMARGRATRWLPALVVLGAPTALYLYRMSIFPDMPWAMRRYLPATFPLVVLLAAAGIGALWAAPAWRRVAAAVVAAATIAFPAWTLAPVADTRSQVPLLHTVREGCEDLGDDAAVLLLRDPGPAARMTQEIRAWCAVPTASVPPGAPDAEWQELADAWAAEGRRLVLLAGGDAIEDGLIPSIAGPHELLWDVEFTVLERTLADRPDDEEPERSRVFVIPIPARPG